MRKLLLLLFLLIAAVTAYALHRPAVPVTPVHWSSDAGYEFGHLTCKDGKAVEILMHGSSVEDNYGYTNFDSFEHGRAYAEKRLRSFCDD